MIKELDCVVLTEDVPDKGLKVGDVGTVVLIHGKNEGYEVEFVTLAGKTIAIVTLLPLQLRAISERDLSHVRELSVT